MKDKKKLSARKFSHLIKVFNDATSSNKLNLSNWVQTILWERKKTKGLLYGIIIVTERANMDRRKMWKVNKKGGISWQLAKSRDVFNAIQLLISIFVYLLYNSLEVCHRMFYKSNAQVLSSPRQLIVIATIVTCMWHIQRFYFSQSWNIPENSLWVIYFLTMIHFLMLKIFQPFSTFLIWI